MDDRRLFAEMREMTDLLNRFGPVVDVAGLSVDQILEGVVATV